MHVVIIVGRQPDVVGGIGGVEVGDELGVAS